MSRSRLSSLDLRAFLRSCHYFLNDGMTLASWTAFQKFLLISDQPEFGVFIRQLKKIPTELQKEMIDGFASGQVESKIWLMETLEAVMPPVQFHAKVLGSWFGLMPRMLLWYFDDRIKSARGYDIDYRWEEHAAALNQPESYTGRARFFTEDMLEIDHGPAGAGMIIINTCCEHLTNFESWYEGISPGHFVVLQGNNFDEPDEHHTLWNSLEDFKKSAPMQTLLFEGTKSFSKYDRYMLIGIK